MEVVDPRSFVPGEMFRESEFRDAVRQFDWKKFSGTTVPIDGCSSKTLPTWAFLVLTAEVAPFAKSISYGELSRPIPVFGKLGSTPETH